jgi:hypothetical protein
VDVKTTVREAKPGASVTFVGKVPRGYELSQIEVHYESLPEPLTLDWLRATRSYGLPKESKILRPKLTPPLMYRDGVKGVIDMLEDGGFRSPVKLYEKEPGIYTIVAWIRAINTEKAFPATGVCVKAL